MRDSGPDDPAPGARSRHPRGGAEPPAEHRLERVLHLVRFLRAHCPWDAEQTPASLVPYLLEEAHEVAEAIRAGRDADLPDELGDLLLNLAFQIVLAEEREAFDAEAVVAAVEDKMRRRHPHLYGDGEAVPWETLKARERIARGRSLVEDLPPDLDPLLRAHRIQERVSGVGFDWAEPAGALDKVVEEVAEVRDALDRGSRDDLDDELGDLLFAVVNLARLAGTHPDHALTRANRKFSGRFRRLERLAAERGVHLESASLEALEALWQEVKAAERG